MASVGITALLHLIRQATDIGRTLTIDPASPFVRRVLDVTGVAQRFDR
jgi:hypothetical protein